MVSTYFSHGVNRFRFQLKAQSPEHRLGGILCEQGEDLTNLGIDLTSIVSTLLAILTVIPTGMWPVNWSVPKLSHY